MDEIFSELFGGGGNPFGGMGHAGGPHMGSPQFSRGGLFGENIFPSFGSGRGSETTAAAAAAAASVPKKADPIERKLACSLEELYKGASKKMRISRNVLDISG